MRRLARLRRCGPVQGAITEQAFAQEHLCSLRILQIVRLHACAGTQLYPLNRTLATPPPRSSGTFFSMAW